MWDYLHDRYDIIELCFMDGGSVDAGSAQQTYWDGYKSVKFQSSERAVGDMLVTYQRISGSMTPGLEPDQPQPSESPSETKPEPAVPDETEKDEETPMPEKPKPESAVIVPVKDPEWKDPEVDRTFKGRLVAMLSIKSILTLTGNGVFLYLTVIGKIAPEVFMAVFSSEDAFYFGTTFTKGSK
jgi:hypothetical protein